MPRLAHLCLLIPVSASADFVTLDRLDASSEVGVEGSYVRRASPYDALGRFDVHGHWTDPDIGIGGYLVAPFKYETVDDRAFEVGIIDLGGLYVRPVAPGWQVVGRIGLGLPTSDARSFLDYPYELDSHAIAMLARAADMATQFHRSTVRLGVSAVFDAERVFGRVDVGADRVFTDDRRTVLRAGAGVGVVVAGRVALMGELVVVHHSEEPRGPHAIAAMTTRLRLGTVNPYAAVVVPLDDASQRWIDVAVTAGVDLSLPD
jgi:hypothetical protein